MFRVLFFFFIVGITLYGVWSLYAPLTNMESESISQQYDEYLSGALARNSRHSQSYDVVFYTRDFDDSKSSQGSDSGNNNSNDSSLNNQNTSANSSSRGGQNSNAGGTSSFGLQQDIASNLSGNFGAPNITIGSENIASKNGNFGTPKTPTTPTVSKGGSSCKGVFFDPCITLNIPETGISGDMYLGKTRIYDDPQDMG